MRAGRRRLFSIAQALENGYTVENIHEITHINKWFLYKIKNIVEQKRLLEIDQRVTKESLLAAKKLGFSDEQIAQAIKKSADEIRQIRVYENIHPSILQIDTLAAEYPAQTNYLYLTYNANHDDIIDKGDQPPVIILGSGPYRIGSSVEFDWCCVNAGRYLRKHGDKTVMINCNPETVSTDYDEFDFLFFEELTLETVEEIYRKLSAKGIIISMGGQVPNNLAIPLNNRGLTILGTTPDKIDIAENRSKFSSLLDELGIGQPEWRELSTLEDAVEFANKIGYPVLVRPSYVLSGAAMGVASNDKELTKFLRKAVDLSKDQPTVISKFLENAKELEFDGVAAKGQIVKYAISEHVENAGVHSGMPH
ncbi:MAG: hypothetical protein U5K00_03495 [Melioribacteraceae bacterium]|nr:hypothetical protein [Melioribacteraceae bacterium]